MKRLFTLFGLLLLSGLSLAQVTIRQDDPPRSYPPQVSKGEFLGNIPPLRTLQAEAVASHATAGKHASKSNYFFANKWNNPDALPKAGDPLAKPSAGNRDDSPVLAIEKNFDGMKNTGLHDPPDPTGDIGKDHYMQMVNDPAGARMQVWNKHTGQSVLGPIPSSIIWGQVANKSIGDPIVQYDHEAGRWLIMELEDVFVNTLLLAVSDGSDPTGSWKAYRFQTFGFGDYPKLYVWPNAYFITVNEIVNGNECSGYALDRQAILNGEPEFSLYRFVMPNYQAIAYQPATGADWEGGAAPPEGSPGYIFRLYDDAWDGGQDHLQIWEVNVDWQNPIATNITGPQKLYPTPFETRVCFGGGLFDCIEQPNANAPRITALENIIMYRAPYRNFGNYESVVFNHVSDVSTQVGDGGDAAVRWYELRKTPNTDWAIYQEGTYAPDLTTNRFMGTICTDESGNIALGYTGVSNVLNPGLYLTGRRDGDLPGEMSVSETTLVPGARSHTNSSRWGDYSNMSVDPEDGQTFWFTGEYQTLNDNWATRVGSFKIGQDSFDIKPIAVTAPQNSATLGNTESVTVQVRNTGINEANGFDIELWLDGALVVTDNHSGSLAAANNVNHTFSVPVDLSVTGQTYAVKVITRWAQDGFQRNDTLLANIKKLTSNDAALVGVSKLSSLVCGTEADFGIIIKNNSGLPMQSARVMWNFNNQGAQQYDWTGNLAPGKKDTIPVHITGIVNGPNQLDVSIMLPNGQNDEAPADNQLPTVEFAGQNIGTQLTVDIQTSTGGLVWEIQDVNGQVIDLGAGGLGNTQFTVCSNDSTCYKVVVRSSTFVWQGVFTVYDIYGNAMVQVFSQNTSPSTLYFCTPGRKNNDVGAFQLEAPQSGPGLTATESITISYRNFGLDTLSDIELSYRKDGGTWHTVNIQNALLPGADAQHTFSTTEDFSLNGGIYQIEFKATTNGDEQPDNDTKQATVRNRALNELELIELHVVSSCNSTDFVQLAMQVRNNGLNTNFNFNVGIVLNGVALPPLPFVISIPTDGITEIPILFSGGFQNGLNTLTADISNVNGQGEDEQPGNDSGSLDFTINLDNVPIKVYFATNEAPLENRWELWDTHGNLLDQGGPYLNPSTAVNLEFCLPGDSCYVFKLFDSAGNGMQGGQVSITDAFGELYWSYAGDNFGSQVDVPFCPIGKCTGFAMNTTVIQPTPANNFKGKIVVAASGGNPPYRYSLNGGNQQTSPVFSNLSPGTYTVVCTDAILCSVEKTVVLGSSATNEPEILRHLQVSPNPSSGMFNVTMPAIGNEFYAKCEVFDSKGSKVQDFRMTRWDNNLHGMAILDKFPDGLYLLKVHTEAGVMSTRLVKQKF